MIRLLLLALVSKLALVRGQAPPPPAPTEACGPLNTPGSVVVHHGDSFGIETTDTMHNTNCHWELDCPGGESTVTFTWFHTESSWDFVNLFSDGSQPGIVPTENPGDLGSFDGTSIPAAVGGATLVQYITDGSVLPSPSGFLATLSCSMHKVDLQVGTGADWCSAWRTERTEHCSLGAFVRTLQELRREQVPDPRVNRTFELSGGESAASEDVASATVRLFSNTDLSLTQLGDEQLVGLFFQNVWVPPRAVVMAASIVFSSGEARPDFTQANIFGERAEGTHGVEPLSEAPGDLSNRTSTDTVVAWELQESDWTDSESAELHTPDISEIVSEIVHQTEWYDGAAMTILFAHRVTDESRFMPLSVALEVSYVSHERRGDLADWAVRGGAALDRLIDRLPQEIYCPCHAVARRMQAADFTNREPVPPVAAQCDHADCTGEWSCDASCTRVWIEERPPSGNGTACPSASPGPCSPGEGECPGNCTGYFQPCTAACESASSRVWVEQAPVYGAGAPCPLPVACIAGDGECAGNSDCTGVWLPCTDKCERVWIESTPQLGTGNACPAAPDCRPSEGACPPNIDCDGYFSPCTIHCEANADRVWNQIAPQVGRGSTCPEPYRPSSVYFATSSPACGPLNTPGSVVVHHGDSFGIETTDTMHNTNCHWELDCPGGESTVTFTWFHTESSWDFVNLFSDGSQPGIVPTENPGDLGSFDGTSIPAAVGGATLVQYITDGSVLPSPSGFLATLSCSNPPPPPAPTEACGPLNTPGSVVVHHGDSFGIETTDTMHNTNCHWELDCPGGESTVTFTWFHTESSWDFVNLFSDGSQPGIVPTENPGDLGSFDGTSIPAAVGGATLVQYITDGSVLPSPSGFLATLSCSINPCPPGFARVETHNGCLSAAVVLGYGFVSHRHTHLNHACMLAANVVSYGTPSSIQVGQIMCELEDDGTEANGWRSYTSIGRGQCTYGAVVDEYLHSTEMYGFREDSDAHIGDIAAVCFALCDSARTEPSCVAVYARPGYCTLYHSSQTATPSGSEIDPAWPTGHCYQREEQPVGSCAAGEGACPVDPCADSCCGFDIRSVDRFDPDECMTYTEADACYERIQWSMDAGISTNPESYPGLTPDSSFEEFQCALAVDPNVPECTAAPCGISCFEGLFFSFEMPSSTCLPGPQQDFEVNQFRDGVSMWTGDVHFTMNGGYRYWGFAATATSGNSYYEPFSLSLYISTDRSGEDLASGQTYFGRWGRLDGISYTVDGTWHFLQTQPTEPEWYETSWTVDGVPIFYIDLGSEQMINSATHRCREGHVPASGFIVATNDPRGEWQPVFGHEGTQEETYYQGPLVEWPDASVLGRQVHDAGNPNARPFETGDRLCVLSCPAWQVVLRETRAQDPTAYSSTVDGMLRTFETQAAVPAHSRVRLEWDYACSPEQDQQGVSEVDGVSCYQEFIEWDAAPAVFEDAVNPNIHLSGLTSSSDSGFSGETEALFCRACTPSADVRQGDTCWAVTPISDTNRECGCNSGGWSGTGVYYGGWPSGTCNNCGCQGGAFVRGFRSSTAAVHFDWPYLFRMFILVSRVMAS